MKQMVFVAGRGTEDITGQLFTRLKATQFAGFIGNGLHKWPAWICECQCEKKTITPPILASNLKSGHTTSCGCIQVEVTIARSTIHGDAPRKGKTKEWYAWVSAQGRTDNPNHPRSEYYGARGIKMCDFIKTSYINFKSIIEKCPPDKNSLGRINNDGHYSCGKCEQCVNNGWPMNLRWENHQEQMNNTTTSIKIGGKSISQIATEENKTIDEVRRERGLR